MKLSKMSASRLLECRPLVTKLLFRFESETLMDSCHKQVSGDDLKNIGGG